MNFKIFNTLFIVYIHTLKRIEMKYFKIFSNYVLYCWRNINKMFYNLFEYFKILYHLFLTCIFQSKDLSALIHEITVSYMYKLIKTSWDSFPCEYLVANNCKNNNIKFIKSLIINGLQFEISTEREIIY